MLTEDKIIAIYCFVDYLLKGTGRQEDMRRKVSDNEIIISAIVSALHFGGHLDNGRNQLADELVFKPLGMTNSHYTWDAQMDEARFAV